MESDIGLDRSGSAPARPTQLLIECLKTGACEPLLHRQTWDIGIWEAKCLDPKRRVLYEDEGEPAHRPSHLPYGLFQELQLAAAVVF